MIGKLKPEIAEQLLALKNKALAKQAAIDACDGHIWSVDYVSKISSKGGSKVCIRCGERSAWRNDSQLMEGV